MPSLFKISYYTLKMIYPDAKPMMEGDYKIGDDFVSTYREQ
jgi:hypothetical protein